MLGKIICPECKAEMRLVGGRNGPFWSCGNYPTCKKIVFVKQAAQYAVPDLEAESRAKANFKPSHYQQALFDAIENIDIQPTRHIIVDAKAGSGKTTSTVQGVLRIPNRRAQRIAYVAFNNNIVDTLRERLPVDSEVKTTHSAALQDVRQHLGTMPKIGDEARYKVADIAKRFLPQTLITPTAQLVSKVKNTLSPTDPEALEILLDKYDIDIGANLPENATDEQLAEAKQAIFMAMPNIITACATETDLVDFDDMLWLPVYNNWPIRRYDWLLVDEVQDLNACQHEWVYRAGYEGHIVAVGDPDQAIFIWRGADTNAMDILATRLNAQQLPLSICYRCPQLHIQLAQQIVPDIEAAPNAIEGVLGRMGMHELVYHKNHPTPGNSLVLCRVNAPLIKYAYAFMDEGIPVTIRGRDLAEGLIALIKKMQANSIAELARKIEEYYDREYARFMKQNKADRAHALTDRIDTLRALLVQASTVSQLIYQIETLFPRKDSGKPSVVLSTVHRAKGDEAEKVYILRPDLIPHPKAKTEEQMRGEKCVQYVAYTRAKEELWFVEK